MRQFNLPDPSNDATFLRLHSTEELEQRLGDVQDDSQNTFTARMLLLLESRPFYGEEAYRSLLQSVVNAYWRNHDRHKTDYLPIVLVNDVVRYWRIVLLNYEAKHSRKAREAKTPKDELDRNKRFDSYKLRFARCMTCYSMIAALLWESQNDPSGISHVSGETMLSLIEMSPVQRLQLILNTAANNHKAEIVNLVTDLLGHYRTYLESRMTPDIQLKALLDEDRSNGSLFKQADRFGETMFKLVQALGQNSPLIRYVVV